MSEQDAAGQLDQQAVVVVGPALVIRPGDRLIVGCAGPVTMAQADQIKGQLHDRLPGLDDVVIITGVAQLAAYRAESADGD